MTNAVINNLKKIDRLDYEARYQSKISNMPNLKEYIIFDFSIKRQDIENIKLSPFSTLKKEKVLSVLVSTPLDGDSWQTYVVGEEIYNKL